MPKWTNLIAKWSYLAAILGEQNYLQNFNSFNMRQARPTLISRDNRILNIFCVFLIFPALLTNQPREIKLFFRGDE